MLANVLLPAMMFLPPAVVAVLVCEVAVYWLLLRRGHKFWRVVRVVLIVNGVSALFGWVVYPPATALPPPHPMAVLRIPEKETPDELAAARQGIVARFAEGCVLSIVIEALTLAVFGREFPWRRLAAAVVASNVLSYLVLWVGFLSVIGRL